MYNCEFQNCLQDHSSIAQGKNETFLVYLETQRLENIFLQYSMELNLAPPAAGAESGPREGLGQQRKERNPVNQELGTLQHTGYSAPSFD